MSTTPYPPARDPERIPDPAFEDPDDEEQIEYPDGGEQPEDDPDADEDDKYLPDDKPLRAQAWAAAS